MIPFKNITLGDKSVVERFTLNGPRRTADMLFANIMGWKHITHIRYAVVEDMLVFRCEMDGMFVYSLPYGNGNLRFVLMRMLEDAEMMGVNCSIFGVPENRIADVESAMPGHFDFAADEGSSDYVYLRENLVELSGKKLQAKRNHVNKFERLYPDARFVEITDELLPQCKELEFKWNGAQLDVEHSYITPADELKFTMFMLDNRKALGLRGGALTVDGRVAAFTLGAPVNADTFDVCVEKADSDFEGAYATVNRCFAASLPPQFVYVNREEDMGIEGLRQAKLSYHPEMRIKKYVATPRLAYTGSIFCNNEGMVPPPSGATFKECAS